VNGRRARQWLVLAGPAVLLLLGVYLYPLLKLLVLSLGVPPALASYGKLASNALFLAILIRTFRISAIVTLVCLVAAYPVAYLLTRAGTRVAAVIMIAILLPFWTSILVRTYAWMVLLQNNGLVNKLLMGLGIVTAPLRLMYNEAGVTIGMVQILLPFAILPVYASLHTIDPRLHLAARILGAGAWQRFWRVTFPLSLPGVGAAAILVFVQALGYFVTPALLGGSRVITLAMYMESNVLEVLNWQLAAAMAMVLLVVCVGIVGGFERMLGVERVWR
jgi:ABC-type spermidine/putrescine transport system permease subunit I